MTGHKFSSQAGARLRTLLTGTLLILGTALAIPQANAAADPNKVLRVALDSADSGLDMAKSNNSLYSIWIGDTIFEALLGYDYLARPFKLVPRLAQSLPEISADGLEYTFKLRQGVLFSPDPVFKGRAREVTAQDVVYSLKRVVDPELRSPTGTSFEGKIRGLDELIKAARKGSKFNYDTKVEGLQAVDKYTVKIRLLSPMPTLSHQLTSAVTGVVAREAIEHYGANTSMHPVGTGPYMLHEYKARSKIILVANPNYRGFTWDFAPSEAKDDKLVAAMKGKQMPQIGRVEVSIVEEDQSRWLAFEAGQFDFDILSPALIPSVLEGGTKLKPKYAAQNLQLDRYVSPDFVHYIMNMRDPLIGGFSKEKIALRRAIMMAYLVEDEIKHLRNGQALRAESPIPPGLAGHDPNFKRSVPVSPQLANALLDKFGYKKGADGYRTLPDGKPLTLKIHGNSSGTVHASNELWKRSMDAIGLRTEFPISNFGDNLKAAQECKLMMWGLGSNAGIPDAMDFVENYYGPNSGQGNLGCYQSANYDKLFEQMKVMPDSPERTRLLAQMMRQLEADSALVPQVWRIRNIIVRPYILGFKRHPIMHANWAYLDIDMTQKK